jgi:hypothetical protein
MEVVCQWQKALNDGLSYRSMEATARAAMKLREMGNGCDGDIE